MRYIPHTEKDIQEMLRAIGVGKVEELFHSIPEALRLEQPLDLPPALAEADLTQTLGRLAHRNMGEDYSVFLGAGVYRHFTPSVVNHLILRGEFLTSYTPYQPEVSQGTLQAIFEFQSMVCLLTGMEIANASIYDGATSLAEAVLMAHRVNRRNEVLMARTVHPEYRQVVNTYTRGIEFHTLDIPYLENGRIDLEFVRQKVNDNTSAVVIQSPNFFGVVEQYAELGEFLKEKKTLLIVVVAEAGSLGLLKPPGERGADIAVGEGQSWGLPVSYGGPYVGFFAAKEAFFRQIPGRIVGETVDREGRRSYALTLATREQHIRREKATSNICTNQGLCALAATIYLSAMGKAGVREVALQNLKTAAALKNKLAQVKGFRLKFEAETYNEFVLECPGSAKAVHEKLLERQIVAG
nr:aminomethyl-transferring glycine dehydrogenase subunit GcvPA [Nitrospinaceae bacterium]NIR54436.1 aminomethyl-transferring glycine dehydrogenase subunit GcvPA [Nitrospinaceae bacterium]NIS84853.1 aminomethyl-transferring glycine dehydrogenase subunit GcvPA [Nitrospinaceae bacterium]NIT81658.1 aminomethyl-transferring glycine dehydrogenase subunit GcvPA [Nitrospinaceae bacterium]NIU43935.1 aminomethyl-transferring glycine dehydrogenase subunit GcvPA [Nitrospinaceae bacterium]